MRSVGHSPGEAASPLQTLTWEVWPFLRAALRLTSPSGPSDSVLVYLHGQNTAVSPKASFSLICQQAPSEVPRVLYYNG